MMQNSTQNSVPNDDDIDIDAALPSSVSTIEDGKREGEDELEKLVSAKKRKIDEVSEKQKNVKEIGSDDSTSYPEQDQKSAKYGMWEKKLQAVKEIDKGDSSEENEETQKKKRKTMQNAASISQQCDLKIVEKGTSTDILDGDDVEDHDDDDDSSGDSETLHMPVKDSENIDESDEETEEKSSKTPQEWIKDVEMVASIGKKAPKTSATFIAQNATSKRICVRNLSYSVERADMEILFKECGEIVDVRFITDSEGRFRGFGYVSFATAEAAQKALELDNTELLRRPIKVSIARERGKYISSSSFSNFSNTFQTGGSAPSQTVFVAGFNKSFTKEKIKASLKEHFSSCGEITRISVPTYHDSEAVKGFAHLDFKDFDSYRKALQLDKTEIGGYYLSVEKAMPRRRGYQYGGRDGGYLYGGRYGGDHQYGGRDGGYQYGGRDGGHLYGGRYGGDRGMRSWGRSGGSWRH